MISLKKITVLCSFVVTALSANAQPGGITGRILNDLKPKKKFEGQKILVKKSRVIFAGVGFPNNISSFLNLGTLGGSILAPLGIKDNSTNKIGPVSLGGELLITDEIGLGITFNFTKATRTLEFRDPLSSSNTPITTTGNVSLFQIAGSSYYHLYTTDKLDPYFKGTIGINIWNGDIDGNKNSFPVPTPVAYQGAIGLRYFVSPKFAIYGEGAYGNLKLTGNLGMLTKL